MEITLRKYSHNDSAAVVKLFHDTVHSINSRDYSDEQIKAWAPDNIDVNEWQKTLAEHYTLVAEYKNEICGFGDIDDTGYFDHLFVHKKYQGHGIATIIANAIEKYADNKELECITVAASITAKPFFTKRGYSIVREQQVTLRGQIFTNFFMKKEL